jgi:hypothetical protein
MNIYSCNDINQIAPSTTDENLDFEYTESDDEPIMYNTLNGGSEVKYFDGCIYFFNGNSSGRQKNHATLYRFNVKTGNLTTVCPDPLCEHNTPDCPFYSMDSIYYIYENKIYYSRTYFLDIDFKETGYYADFVSFDLSDSKLKQYIVYSDSIPEAVIGSELYIDKYRFYYDAIVDSKTNNIQTAICRMNLEDGSIDILIKDNSSNNDKTSTLLINKFLFAVNQRIYFTDGREIYSTDYDMNNRQYILSGNFSSYKILTDGEYIYWGESEDSDNTDLQTLYRSKLDGSGERFSLGIKTEDWQLTENYIYYLNTSETNIGKNNITQRNSDDIVLTYNEIRRAALDGSSNEKVFSLINDDTNYEIYYYTCVGNYIYAAYNTFIDNNKDGVFDDSEYYQSIVENTYTILRIDVTTGDTYYIHCGTEENYIS